MSRGAGRVFCTITVPPHTGEGKYHQHVGEYEIWHILEGYARVKQDGEMLLLETGDTVVCEPGSSHCISNGGDVTLVFLAIVLYEK